MEGSKGSKAKLLKKDCGPKCKSQEHARQLVSACTKGSTRQLQLYLSRCYNTSDALDIFGRNVLHMAASKGKWEVVKWLLEEKKVDPELKDVESEWTALHRALFYGQIATARILINHGVDMHAHDKDDLGPLDILMKDRLPHVQFTTTGLYEAHSWGDNLNSTLGHNTEQRKRHPEIIDYFRKNGIIIKDVVMSKYHTVFCTYEGNVYTCGHGQGGRLGHGNQQTYLTPKLVENIQTQSCSKVAASRDHTLFLMTNGSVYSCGLNSSRQLGIMPPPDHSLGPRLINTKVWKGKQIKGICAQRFHSVVYTDSAVYTFGLNAGQIGHLKVPGESLITQPRMVSAFNYKDFQIKHVTASDAATAVATTKGDIYILYKYQCRKIVSKWLDLEQITISGGHLDHDTDLETLREKGGYELVILLRNSAGKVYMWRDSDPKLKRCVWSIRRPLHISQVSLSVQNFVFVTDDGEAFKATIPKRKLKERTTSIGQKDIKMASSPPTDTFTMSVTDLVEKEDVVDIHVEKLPLIHRAVDIVVDKKGNNFTVLQSQPNASLTEIPTIEDSNMQEELAVLLEEANECDLIHDVILEVGNHIIPAHKYVLAYKSEYFRKMFAEKDEEVIAGEMEKIVIESVNYEVFLQMLKYIYTDTCDVLKSGAKVSVTMKEEHHVEMDVDIPEPTFQVSDGKKQSAYDVYQQAKIRTGKEKKKETTGQSRQRDLKKKNPVILLQQMASRFGVRNLSKRLDAVKWADGKIQLISGRCLPRSNPKFDRTKYPSLYDVRIKADDDSVVECHKCILVARLEYFRSMLGSGWVETSNTEALTLPIPGDILHIVITFLYTDKAEEVNTCENVEFLCNILVVADQLLIGRLKHMCEVQISALLMLKNVCEVLEFAALYNANRLKKTCQQFICLNLALLLETRSLDILSDDVMDELTVYYRSMVPAMERRLITPFDESPSIAYLEELEAEYDGIDLTQITEAMQSTNQPSKKTTKKTKRQRTRTKSSGDDSEGMDERKRRSSERQISVSSETDFPIELDHVAEEDMERSSTETSRRLTIQIPRINLNTVWNSGAKKMLQCETNEIIPATTEQTVSPPVAASPPGLQTLREIMDQEIKASRPNQSEQRSTTGPAKKKPKMSNNERRRQAKQQQLELQLHSPDTVQSPPAEGSVKSAWTGWGSPPVSSVVSSFKDLMLHDEKSGAKPKHPAQKYSANPPVSSRGDSTTISWGLTQRGATPKTPTTYPVTPTSPRDGENPWTKKSSDRQAIDFSSIVADEIQQRKSLVKAINKPLAFIQIEEQAIQELMYQYAADTNVDEHITVSRVTRVMATPMWHATSHRH